MGRRWAWLLVVLTGACSVAEVVVMLLTGVPVWSHAAFRNAFPLVNLATVVGALVGAVILSRHPRHRVGWLFCWGQLGVATGLLLRAVADGTTSGTLVAAGGAGRLWDLLANLLGSMLALVLLAALLLLAPDGQLPSRRWRPSLILLVGSYASLSIGLVSEFHVGGDLVNEVVQIMGQIGVLTALLASVVALLVRLVSSTGETRLQLRWIVAAAAVLAVAPAIALVFGLSGEDTPDWVIGLLHVGYLGVPVATGIAVLRYRLYDIDRLVGGSVVLAVLTVLTLSGYVATVGLVGLALPGTDADSWLSLAVFVAVVLVVQPFTRYVRRLAERLVYGPQSMSYAALVRFTHDLSSPTSSSPGGRQFLREVAEAAGRLVTAHRCSAVLIEDDGSERIATWSADASGRPAHGSTWETLVTHQGLPAGRLEVVLPDVPVGGIRRRQLLAALADRLAEGFVHARLECSLRRHAAELSLTNQALDESRRRLLAARDMGRRRVADRIRQEVVERMVPVGAGLDELARSETVEREAATAMVDAALASTAEAIEQLRLITSTVYSRRLAEEGLAAALRAIPNADAELAVIGDERWSPAVESWLFTCCSDLLQGAVGRVSVELRTPDHAHAEVALTTAGPVCSGVLSSTRERIQVVGGTIVTSPSRLVLRVPLVDADARC